MTNDNRSVPGTGLLPCFAPSIEALDGAIQRVAESGISGGASLRDVEACLLTIRANAAGNTPGLYSALDAVRSSFRAIEDIARRPADLILNRAGLLIGAQSHAQSAVGFLVEVLRQAKPNGRLTPP
ncbi:MICOS complex subunit MIC60 [Methylobacterium sp. E-005]|uniref:MICOS complex subunit MIC60 n=1 Tax=Methylobacterium sp. E-005 TaxID=2836549 RepID=UPI001FB9B7D0|nr:MICOS complex subunit MIC60 [Methylobacterium sp. E-005]MCJ2089057.1 MICOS complex subunit MIC60 [Methylobacterium sp. E-005]